MTYNHFYLNQKTNPPKPLSGIKCHEREIFNIKFGVEMWADLQLNDKKLYVTGQRQMNATQLSSKYIYFGPETQNTHKVHLCVYVAQVCVRSKFVA